VKSDPEREIFYITPSGNRNVRLDAFLTTRPLSLSRARIQALIKQGHITVNDRACKPSHALKTGDRICVSLPDPVPCALIPQRIDFAILYEDEALLVLNKPAGLVVHPAPGHASGTLVHGLLDHCNDLSGIGGCLRPGIVHRLDKDTSGLMVVAKDDKTHESLSQQFKSGGVKKHYVALIDGRIGGEKGKIDLPIARHPRRRKQMSVVPGGKQALTLWRVLESFGDDFSLLLLILKTGRTHQIRVHLAHMGHPVLGDPVYGRGMRGMKHHRLCKKGLLGDIDRQLLHAKTLGFRHPRRDLYMEFHAPMPEDMEAFLKSLREATLD